MKLKLTLILFAALLIGSGTLSAQAEEDVLKLSLKEAQDMAVANSQDMVLAGIERGKAKAQVQQAMSALLPQVNSTISYTQYGKLPSTLFPNDQAFIVNQTNSIIQNHFQSIGQPLPPGQEISVDESEIPAEAALQFGSKFNVNADVTATQVIFNGVFLVGLQAAAAFESIVEHQERLTKEGILDNVKRSYYQVLAAKENIAVLENNIANLTTLRDETKALFENGFAEGIDVDRIQLSLNNLTTQKEQAIRQVELTEIVLKFQMGIDVYQPIELVGVLEDYMSELDYNLPERGDFNRRTEISLFNVREEVNEFNIKRYKAAYYPSVVGYATVGSSAQRDKFNFFRFTDDQSWFNQRFFGFELNIPIWNSFGTKAQVQNAKLDLEKIHAQREQFFSSLDLNYENAKNKLIEAKENLDFSNENIELAQKIYDVTKIKYREGVGSSIEMTEAERDLYQAQANYLMSVYNLLIAKAEIDKVLGIYE